MKRTLCIGFAAIAAVILLCTCATMGGSDADGGEEICLAILVDSHASHFPLQELKCST